MSYLFLAFLGSALISLLFFNRQRPRKWRRVLIIIIALIGLGGSLMPVAAANSKKTSQHQVDVRENKAARANSSALKKQLATKKTEASQVTKQVACHSRLVKKQQNASESERVRGASASIAATSQASEAAQQQAAIQASQQAQQAASAQQVEQMVTIAPNSGKKYHLDPNCRGLSRANSTTTMPLSQAQAEGYTLCGWED